jgi:hypothetical protein
MVGFGCWDSSCLAFSFSLFLVALSPSVQSSLLISFFSFRQLAEQYGPDAAAHMLSASNLGSGANSPYERSPLGSAANSNVELATMPYAGRGTVGGRT